MRNHAHTQTQKYQWSLHREKSKLNVPKSSNGGPTSYFSYILGWNNYKHVHKVIRPCKKMKKLWGTASKAGIHTFLPVRLKGLSDVKAMDVPTRRALIGWTDWHRFYFGSVIRCSGKEAWLHRSHVCWIPEVGARAAAAVAGVMMMVVMTYRPWQVRLHHLPPPGRNQAAVFRHLLSIITANRRVFSPAFVTVIINRPFWFESSSERSLISNISTRHLECAQWKLDPLHISSAPAIGARLGWLI